jgi:anti-sigma B factor antagonist
MSAEHEPPPEAPPFRWSIEGEMTIYRASERKQELLHALAHPEAVELDLSKVSELDTAGVQLLILAKHTAQSRQAALRFVGHSAAVREVFALLNLAAYFGDPISIETTSELVK